MMNKRDAILKLESVEWAFECKMNSKIQDDLKLTPEFMQLLNEHLSILKDAIQALK